MTKAIIDTLDSEKCYQSKTSLNKCMISLITTNKYKINRIYNAPKSDEELRFISRRQINKQYLKKSKIVGSVYPKHKKYQKIILIYDPNQGIEVFREKIHFMLKLKKQNYKWDEVNVIVSNQNKIYSSEDLLILKRNLTLLNLPNRIKKPSEKSNYSPKNDLDIVKYIFEQFQINNENIKFYTSNQSIEEMMRNWVNQNTNIRAIDIQLNPSIPYYKSKWNIHINYSSNKIEVVGNSGVTKQLSKMQLNKSASLILSNIGLYFSNKIQNKF